MDVNAYEIQEWHRNPVKVALEANLPPQQIDFYNKSAFSPLMVNSPLMAASAQPQPSRGHVLQPSSFICMSLTWTVIPDNQQ